MSLDPLHRPILFSEPDRAVWPPSWIGHIPFAFWLVEALKPTTLVELGTHTGNSFSAFCQAVTALELPTRCFAVDTWAGDPQAGYYGDTVYDELAPVLRSSYRCADLLRMTFDEALSHFADGEIDLLHIDGFHTYEAVSHDFATWRSKLSRRGVVLFHDTTVRQETYEVWRFWDEITQHYPSFSFSHCNGLGVLLVGADVPASVRWLVDTPDERQAIQQFFERLGQRLEAVFNEKQQRQLIKTLNQTITERQDEHLRVTESRDAEIHRLNAVVAKASEDLEALGVLVRERDAELIRRDAQIVDLNQTTQAALTEKAAAIEGVAAREREVIRLQTALEAAVTETAARDALLSSFRARPATARSLRGQAKWLVRGVARRLLRALPEPLKTRVEERLAERVIRAADLFDEAFYLESYPEAKTSGLPPLVYYLRQGAALGHQPHPLFDPVFYLQHHPEVATSGQNPLVHYLRWGAAAGAWPNPLFDPVYYLESHPQVATSGQNPLVHYLRWGRAEGYRTHSLFDPAFYLETYPEVRAAGHDPLVHYLRWGAAAGHRPNPFFDPAYYLETTPEVADSGLDPLGHYMAHGITKGQRPHPLFDPAFYLETYPDVKASGVKPLIHYLRWGAAEGRQPNPLFDPAFYLRTYPDVQAAGADPLIHYLRWGAAEGRWPNALFDGGFYLKSYPEVAASGENPLQHYLRLGAALGYWPNPLFDPAFYLETYPDVGAAGVGPLVHYLRWGAAEGRRPNPLFDGGFYLKSYPEVARLGLDPLFHYLRWGAAEGRWSCRRFHGGFYLETYPDVARLGVNPLHHYLRWGAAEGRDTCRSLRCEEDPQTLPVLPDPGEVLASGPFSVPSVSANHVPAVSVIVPALAAGWAEALNGLRALGRQTVASSCEVIAVITEDDLAAREALALVDGLILVPLPSGAGGIAAAYDVGAERARGERLVFLAPDVIVQDGWLDELAWSLDHLPNAGLVGALVIGAEGWIEAEGGTVRRDGSITLDGRGSDPSLPEHGYARTVGWCPAGALITGAATFRRAGGFGEVAWAAARPELPLALAIRALGFKLYCQSTAAVVRLPAEDGGERAAAAWPTGLCVPREPRWTELLDHAPIPATTELERERALGRRHLLVIDRRLPLLGQSPAGVTALLLLFCELGYRVTLATPALPLDRTPEVRALERWGVHVLRQKPDISVLSFLHRDDVVIDMVLFAHPSVVSLFEPEIADLASTRMLASMGMLPENRNRRPLSSEGSVLPSASSRVLCASGLDIRSLALPAAGSDGWRQGQTGVTPLRDMVLTLVGNGTERDALRQAAPDCPTLVMPSVVPVPASLVSNGAGFVERADIVLPAAFDEWQDGEAAVAFVLDEWPQISRALPGVRLVILATGTAPPVIRALRSAEILVREGADQGGAVLAGVRLAVAPHRSWGGFNQAVATALAHGVPTVMSPTVAQGLGLGAGDPGLVAEPGSAFVERVVAAYGDEENWTRFSAESVRHATEHWSEETVRRRLLQMLHRARFTPTYEISERIQRQALAAKGEIG